MEDLFLSLARSLSSACLWLCQAISNLHFSKSFLTNGKVNTLPRFPLAVLFFSLAPSACSFYPLSLHIGWEGMMRLQLISEIICMGERSCPLGSDLGSVSLQAFMLCREISSLDSAFLLRSLPFFFCILSSHFLSESPPEGERVG